MNTQSRISCDSTGACMGCDAEQVQYACIYCTRTRTRTFRRAVPNGERRKAYSTKKKSVQTWDLLRTAGRTVVWRSRTCGGPRLRLNIPGCFWSGSAGFPSPPVAAYVGREHRSATAGACGVWHTPAVMQEVKGRHRAHYTGTGTARSTLTPVTDRVRRKELSTTEQR